MSADLLRAIMAGAVTAAAHRADSDGPRVRSIADRRLPDAAGFVRSLGAAGVRVITECKRRSPSKGILRDAYDPAAIAAGYAEAGAAAISVLTEPSFFDGALAHLEAVRAAVDVPLLRKDFVGHPFQLVEARASGADAVLLIVAGLDDGLLGMLHRQAAEEGLAVLVEVHDRVELERALAVGATIVGVNSRNLRTLAVDLSLHEQLIEEIPEGVLAVAESGLRTAGDFQRLAGAGYDAFLVGERFMTAPDPGVALAGLLAESGARA